MLYTATSNINIYNFKTENLQSNFEFKTKLNPVDKDVLWTVPNPNFKGVLSDYPHLEDGRISKAFLPIHVILGTSDFTRLKKHQNQNQRITKNSAFHNYEEHIRERRC